MPTLDAHIDLPWQMLKHGRFDINVGADYSAISTTMMQIGGLDRAVFALYVSDAMRAKKDCWPDIIDQASWLPEGHLVALEGGGVLDGSWERLAELKAYYDIKYLTLVHNHDLPWVESATDGTLTQGLSSLGLVMVRECENLGVVVDVSHAADRAIWGVLGASIMPIMASHSGCRAVFDHPRNLPDELIQEIVATEGIICVPFAKRFVGSVDGIARHIDHIVQLVGNVRHVGIGSDLDGAEMVRGIRSAADWSIWQEPLRTMGYTDDNIRQIAGDNLTRFLGAH